MLPTGYNEGLIPPLLTCFYRGRSPGRGRGGVQGCRVKASSSSTDFSTGSGPVLFKTKSSSQGLLSCSSFDAGDGRFSPRQPSSHSSQPPETGRHASLWDDVCHTQECMCLAHALERGHGVPPPHGLSLRRWKCSFILHPNKHTLGCRQVPKGHLVPCLTADSSRVRNQPSVTPKYGRHGPGSPGGPAKEGREEMREGGREGKEEETSKEKKKSE